MQADLVDRRRVATSQVDLLNSSAMKIVAVFSLTGGRATDERFMTRLQG
ncbi:hypothetical protein X744_32340 [Mesorhizobium sp. LNJC372A00]|nr:hypothetical protein X744_32340 [Mesorhizobium sp. LNJC372A00]